MNPRPETEASSQFRVSGSRPRFRVSASVSGLGPQVRVPRAGDMPPQLKKQLTEKASKIFHSKKKQDLILVLALHFFARVARWRNGLTARPGTHPIPPRKGVLKVRRGTVYNVKGRARNKRLQRPGLILWKFKTLMQGSLLHGCFHVASKEHAA